MAGIRVELELVDGTFTTRMLRAGQTVQQFNAEVARSSPALQAMHQANMAFVAGVTKADVQTKSFLATLRDVSIVTGILSAGIGKIAAVNKTWVGDIVRINAEMQRLDYQMRAMSKAADPIKDAANTVAFLRQKALEVPFSMKAITDSFVKMKATGTDPLNGSLQSLMDGVAASGGTDESLKRAVLAISQISGKGVLQMEELRQQLGESMPRAAELMARSMGVSMSTLIKEISSGTVAAKPALQALFAELDRTYGGRAQQMMATFDGQLTRTKTLLQNLATGGTIKSSFFDGALMTQLRDLNDFLDSDAAGRLRDQLGNGLTSVVQTIRSVIDGVIGMRNEFMRFASVAATAFAMRTAMNGLQAFVGVIQSTREGLRLAALQAQATSVAFTRLDVSMILGFSKWTQFRNLLSATVSTVAMVATGIGAMMPWITAIGLGVYVAAEYFGVFANKAQEAYDNLVQFGAESRKQAQEVVQNQEDALKAKVAELENAKKQGALSPFSLGFNQKIDQDIADAKKKLIEFRGEASRILAEAGKREDQKVLNGFTDGIQAEFDKLKQAYDTNANAIVDKYNALETEASNKGESVETVKEQRRKEAADVQKKFYQDQINLVKSYIDYQNIALNYQTGTMAQQTQQKISWLQGQLRQLNESMQAVDVAGVQKIAKPTNEKKAFENGQALLAKLQAEAAGLREEVDGGMGAVAELQEMLNQNKFGDQSRDDVKALDDAIIAQKTQNELLKEKAKLLKEENRAYDNGADYVNKLKADIEGFKAQLGGDNFAVAQLQSLLDSGKFGDKTRKDVQSLITEAMQLKRVREDLKKQVDDMTKADQAFDNGQNQLRNITAEVKGMVAALGGANEKVVEMNELLMSGKFGSQDEERVHALTEQLEAAVTAKEKLDKIMEGKKTLEADIKNAEAKAAERLMEAQIEATGRTMTDAEKVAFKMQRGFYEGFGSDSQIKAAMTEVANSLTTLGINSDALAINLKDNAFGDETIGKINTVTEALSRMASQITSIGSGVNGINFSNMGMPGGGLFSMLGSIPGVVQKFTGDLGAFYNQIRGKANLMSRNPGMWGGDPSTQSWRDSNLTTIGTAGGLKAEVNKAAAAAFQGFIQELEKSGYKIGSISGYSYRNKVGAKGLSEHAFGNAIDINPGANPLGSSLVTNMPANVSQMAAKYGLSWGGDWKSRKDAMHFEWTGMVPSDSDMQKTTGFLQTVDELTRRQAAAQKQYADRLAAAQVVEEQAKGVEYGNKRTKLLEELKVKATDAAKPVEELGKNYLELSKQIQTGDLGPNKNLDAKEYQDLIKAAKELDRVEDDMAKKKKAKSALNNAEEHFTQTQIELNRRAAEAMARITDPLERKSSSAFRALRADLEDYVRDVERSEGKGTTAAINAAQYRDTMLRQFRNVEVAETAAGYAKKTQEIRRGLMTETQARAAALQEQLAAIDKEVADFNGSEQEKVQIVAAAEAQKAALRQQYAQQASPLTQQMQAWGDIQGQLAEGATRWMDSLAGGLTDLITGTGDLRSALQGILKDIVNMGVKYMLSGMFNKGSQTSGGKGGGSKKSPFVNGATSVGKGKGVGVPLHHAGGIIGGRAFGSKMVSGSIFDGAPKFHGGGIIGGQALAPDEQAIIGLKGEGVFTRDQMSAIGTGLSGQTNQISISAPVTVNANGGTHAENADLAKQVSKEVNSQMRAVVVDEITRQMKPGNMLSKGMGR